MVWKSLKMKNETQVKPDIDEPKKNVKGSCRCGERCKKCGDNCKCATRRFYLRPPMFNYFTDMMH